MRNPRAVARLIRADICLLRVGASVAYRTEDLRRCFGAAHGPDARPVEAWIRNALPDREFGLWAVETLADGGTVRITRRAAPRGWNAELRA